jgi:hypothetical protein
MSNNAAERDLRAVAVGRKNWTFAGSDEGGRRAAAIYSLIATAKLNDIDPQAWLADVLARLHPAKRIQELMSWNSADLRTSLRPYKRGQLNPLKIPNQGPSPDAYLDPAGVSDWIRRLVKANLVNCTA